MKRKSDVTPARRWRPRVLPAILLLVAVGMVLVAARAEAVPGQSRGLVQLPGNGGCSVAGAYDGTFYITINTNSCSGTTVGIYQPPALGSGPATPVSTKPVVDSGGNPVTLSAVDWDTSRNLLWGVHGTTPGQAYLIDLGDKTMSGPATATLQFTYNLPGEIPLIDGLAWDFTDDTLWISPDVSCNVFHFSTGGALLGSIQPKNAAGVEDCVVSGVAIGSANTLYIGRNGLGEIRRVNKADGTFVATHATANFRIEDLVCAGNLYRDPPLIGTPIEVILAKGAFTQDYEAFEVEAGTCPSPVEECPPEEDEDDDGVDDEDERNILGNLLNDSDSDDDGVLDGNDDGNGNGEDDEDEDDDDGDDCPEEDDDGDGVDDEDEDDDEDDD
jgi:hypothetical protein